MRWEMEMRDERAKVNKTCASEGSEEKISKMAENDTSAILSVLFLSTMYNYL